MSASGPSPDINTWRGEPCRGSRNGPVWKPYRLIRGMSDKSTYALVKATSSGFRQCRSARGSYRRSLDRRPDRRSFWWRGSARRPRSPQRAGWTRESVTLHRGRDRTWRQDGQSRRQRHHGRGQSLLLPVAVRPFMRGNFSGGFCPSGRRRGLRPGSGLWLGGDLLCRLIA